MVTVVKIVVVVASTVLGVEVNPVTVETVVVTLPDRQCGCGKKNSSQNAYSVVVGVTVINVIDVKVVGESEMIFVVVVKGVGNDRHEQAVESALEAKAWS